MKLSGSTFVGGGYVWLIMCMRDHPSTPLGLAWFGFSISPLDNLDSLARSITGMVH